MNTVTIHNEHSNTMNIPLKTHCRKCGRRHRSQHNSHKNNSRLKSKIQARPFPKEYPTNILIDQFIQVQQLNPGKYHDRTMDNDNRCVQQMIYLRENINNSTYREFHFPSEYILLKRLEEKNHLIHQTRLNVDHCYRSLKLQYQIMSMEYKTISIGSYSYSKQHSCVNRPASQASEHTGSNQQSTNDTRDHLSVPNNRSIATINHTNETFKKDYDNTTNTNEYDSSILFKPLDRATQNQYSQNALPMANTKRDVPTFDTAVIVDVTKCRSIDNNSNQISPIILNIQTQQEVPQCYIPDRSIYYDQYTNLINAYQPQNTLVPLLSTSHFLYQPYAYTESFFNPLIYQDCRLQENPQTLSNLNQPGSLPYVATSQMSSNENQTNLSSSQSQTSTSHSHSDDRSTISTVNINEHSYPKKSRQTINRIKQILNNLQKNLLNKSIPKDEDTHVSLSTTIASDSLIQNTTMPTTYSVTSVLPSTDKHRCRLSCNLSGFHIDHETSPMDSDSLNIDTNFRFLNSAKNINANQQSSDDETEESSWISIATQPKRIISNHLKVRYMSSSFMFILQILLILCLAHKMVRYSMFGIVSDETLTSLLIDTSQYVTPTSSSVTNKIEQTIFVTNRETFRYVFSLFF